MPSADWCTSETIRAIILAQTKEAAVRVMLDVPDDVLAKIDLAVIERQAQWHAAPKVARSSKPRRRQPSSAELHEALKVAKTQGTEAGNAWLKAKTTLPWEPVPRGRRAATDEAACPSRTSVMLELMTSLEVLAAVERLSKKGKT